MLKKIEELRCDKNGRQVLLVEKDSELWIWKPACADISSLSEVAFYQASQMVGYSRVPKTIFSHAEMDGRDGTLQKHIDGAQPSALAEIENLVSAEGLQNLAVFDFMMNLSDRNLNMLVASDGVWAIDNGTMSCRGMAASSIEYLIGQPLLESSLKMVDQAQKNHAAIMEMIEKMCFPWVAIFPWVEITEQQKASLRQVSVRVGARIRTLTSAAKGHAR